MAYRVSGSRRILDTIKSINQTKKENLIKYRAFDFRLAKRFHETFMFDLRGLKNRQNVLNLDKKYFGDDGVIFDTINSSNKGVPDLVYHCRNLELITSNIYWNDCDKYLMQAKNGLEFAYKLICSDYNLFYYGRSNDSVYGLSSLLMSFVMERKFF